MELLDEIQRLLSSSHSSQDRPLNNSLSPQELLEKINLDIEELPASQGNIQSFVDQYIEYSVNTQHSFYSNQLWSKTEDPSILGEFISALTNTSMYTFEVAPVATLMEIKMRDYLTQLIWRESTDGIMTSGGTASNMQALLTARHHHNKNIKNQGLDQKTSPLMVYCAENAHYSIKRSINILGIGQEHLIEIPTNSQGQMPAELLEKAIEKTESEGKRPLCVISTAGTTVSGSFDNITDIGKLCYKRNIWFHIDGAYGGSVLLSEKHSHLLDGAQYADSFSWDFHKMLGINLPCAFLLTKKKGLLQQALSSGNDSYLFHDEDSIDLGPSSLQCGRRNDILKLWLSWKSFGKKGLANRVDILFSLAKKFAYKIQEDKEFELLLSPQSINICFRLKDSNKTQWIREYLRQSGKLMINYSSDQQGDFFRLAITNPSLKERDLDQIISFIKEGRDASNRML